MDPPGICEVDRRAGSRSTPSGWRPEASHARRKDPLDRSAIADERGDWVVAVPCAPSRCSTVSAGLRARCAQEEAPITRRRRPSPAAAGTRWRSRSDGSRRTHGASTRILQLGIGPGRQNVLKPARVRNLTRRVQRRRRRVPQPGAQGGRHGLGVRRERRGAARHGQRSARPQGTPVQVAGSRERRSPSTPTSTELCGARGRHRVGLGSQRQGQLGNGTPRSAARAGPGEGLRGIPQVAAGYHHTLALAEEGRGGSGTVYGWGEQRYGQVGDGKTCKSARRAAATAPPRRPCKGLGGKATAIAAGQLGDYSLALMDDGTVMAWGRNDQGQLGRGTLTTNGCRCEPEAGPRASGLKNVKAIAASGGAGAALKTDGSVWAWGNNRFGQLGNGKAGGDRRPTHRRARSAAWTRAEAIEAGGGFVLARDRAAELVGWGINDNGELGVGNQDPSQPSPVVIGVAQEDEEPVAARPERAAVDPRRGRAHVPPAAGDAGRARSRPRGAPAASEPWPGGRAGAPAICAARARRARRRQRRDGVLDRAWREWAGPSPPARTDGPVRRPLRRRAARRWPRRSSRCRSRPAASWPSDEPGDGLLPRREPARWPRTADIGGEPRELARLGPGDFFGEAALLGRDHALGHGAGGHRRGAVDTRGEATSRTCSLATPRSGDVVGGAADRADGARREPASSTIEERSLTDLGENGQEHPHRQDRGQRDRLRLPAGLAPPRGHREGPARVPPAGPRQRERDLPERRAGAHARTSTTATRSGSATSGSSSTAARFTARSSPAGSGSTRAS